MTNHKPLQKRRFYRSDPVASLLIEKLHLSTLSVGLLSIAITAGFYLVTAWISNTLWSKPEQQQLGLLEDWLPWIWVLFINPVVLGYYLWSFQAIGNVIQDLEASDVVETDTLEIDQIGLKPYNQKWRKFLALGSAVCLSIYVLITRPGLEKSWTNSGLLPTLTVTITSLVVVYMGSMLVLNLITNVWVLHHILGEKELSVSPLHPDRCGGLRSLSDYSLKTAYLAAILGIMVGLIEYQFITQGSGLVYWLAHLIIPLHIALSMACFFGPLLAAHRGMKRAKEELLNEISQQFQKDYSQTHTSLTMDVKNFKKNTEKIKELQELYTFTNQFPVWPFDIQTLRRFLITVPSPILPLIPKFIEILLKK